MERFLSSFAAYPALLYLAEGDAQIVPPPAVNPDVSGVDAVGQEVGLDGESRAAPPGEPRARAPF